MNSFPLGCYFECKQEVNLDACVVFIQYRLIPHPLTPLHGQEKYTLTVHLLHWHTCSLFLDTNFQGILSWKHYLTVSRAVIKAKQLEDLFLQLTLPQQFPSSFAWTHFCCATFWVSPIRTPDAFDPPAIEMNKRGLLKEMSLILFALKERWIPADAWRSVVEATILLAAGGCPLRDLLDPEEPLQMRAVCSQSGNYELPAAFKLFCDWDVAFFFSIFCTIYITLLLKICNKAVHSRLQKFNTMDCESLYAGLWFVPS